MKDVYQKLKQDAEKHGYLLNPDVKFTKKLIKGLLENEKRYGYWACPCRLASGKREKDLDIICPCDYRDEDIIEHGVCYCALYVSNFPEKRKNGSIPERRGGKMKNAKIPVWRCKVCGYLCAREHPPEKCPICGADSDRFENFE